MVEATRAVSMAAVSILVNHDDDDHYDDHESDKDDNCGSDDNDATLTAW